LTERRVSTHGKVLFLLCALYFISYIDRVNLAAAAGAIQADLHLSHTELGLAFSAFAYPYLLFQIIGGWVSDRFGPHRTLLICGLLWTGATLLMGWVDGLVSLVAVRVMLGFGEGASFPTATRALAVWTPVRRRGFAQGITHSSARLGNAITPPLVAALIVLSSWHTAFVLLGIASSLWVIAWWVYFRDDPRRHGSIIPAELRELPSFDAVTQHAAIAVPWGRLARRMAPLAAVEFCYAWTLWVYLNWLPSFFLHGKGLDIKGSAWFASGVFCAGIVGDTLGGVISDRLFQRTGDLQLARRNLVVIACLGALLSLAPVLFMDGVIPVAIALASGFFFLELMVAPMWTMPVDIAPLYSGTASGLMNSGGALAAIISPVVFGLVIDATGRWELPFAGSILLLLGGAAAAFAMHPERPLDAPPQSPARPAAAPGPCPVPVSGDR
jgi:sugar phosphate permease